MTGRSAVLSDCGLYRYGLARTWGASPMRMVMFVMLNPSTADADNDDPTIRRCVNFAKAWGYDGIYVCNLYAYRTPYPAALGAAYKVGTDVVGPDNDVWLQHTALVSELVVCAWGQLGPKRDRAFNVCKMLARRSKLHALAFTKVDDQPRHPLMLPKNLVPLEYHAV